MIRRLPPKKLLIIGPLLIISALFVFYSPPEQTSFVCHCDLSQKETQVINFLTEIKSKIILIFLCITLDLLKYLIFDYPKPIFVAFQKSQRGKNEK